MPLALIAMVFSIMLEFRFGTLNQLLHGIGLDFLAQRWLSDPTLAYMSIISISVFLIGLPMMYYNADMTTINAAYSKRPLSMERDLDVCCGALCFRCSRTPIKR